jgi:hypothetical protein
LMVKSTKSQYSPIGPIAIVGISSPPGGCDRVKFRVKCLWLPIGAIAISMLISLKAALWRPE